MPWLWQWVYQIFISSFIFLSIFDQRWLSFRCGCNLHCTDVPMFVWNRSYVESCRLPPVAMVPCEILTYCTIRTEACSEISINPNPGSYINWCCCVARSHIWLLRRPIGEREALRHAAAIVRSSGPTVHLERARDRAGGSRTVWCSDYRQGESPAQGWWWRES
jgi:hypothetical protein